jgi:uncharacterized protein
VLLVGRGTKDKIAPMLPGLPLVYAGLLLAAWADGFTHVSGSTMVILGVLTALAIAIDFLAGMLGPKLAGASHWAMLGAAIGLIVGVFFSIPGMILGPFVGALIAEWIYKESLPQATKAGLGAWLGLLLGAVAKVAALFSLLGIFALAWFTN